MNPEKTIQKNRKKLDKITEDLVNLVAKRNKVILSIAKVKRQSGKPIVNIKREKEVLERAKRFSKEMNVDFTLIKKMMKLLIKHARKLQRK